MNSVVFQQDNLTIEKDDQVKPKWYQIAYDPRYWAEQSPHHSDLYEECTIREAEGVELDADDKDETVNRLFWTGWNSTGLPKVTRYGDRSYSRKVNLAGRAIVGIGIRNIDLYRSDEERHLKFKIFACDQD